MDSRSAKYSSDDQALLAAFGMKVRKARLAAGWSIEELADQVGLHRNYVGEVERGVRNVSLLNIYRLAKGLGEPFSEITLATLKARKLPTV